MLILVRQLVLLQAVLVQALQIPETSFRIGESEVGFNILALYTRPKPGLPPGLLDLRKFLFQSSATQPEDPAAENDPDRLDHDDTNPPPVNSDEVGTYFVHTFGLAVGARVSIQLSQLSYDPLPSSLTVLAGVDEFNVVVCSRTIWGYLVKNNRTEILCSRALASCEFIDQIDFDPAESLASGSYRARYRVSEQDGDADMLLALIRCPIDDGVIKRPALSGKISAVIKNPGKWLSETSELSLYFSPLAFFLLIFAGAWILGSIIWISLLILFRRTRQTFIPLQRFILVWICVKVVVGCFNFFFWRAALSTRYQNVSNTTLCFFSLLNFISILWIDGLLMIMSKGYGICRKTLTSHELVCVAWIAFAHALTITLNSVILPVSFTFSSLVLIIVFYEYSIMNASQIIVQLTQEVRQLRIEAERIEHSAERQRLAFNTQQPLHPLLSASSSSLNAAGSEDSLLPTRRRSLPRTSSRATKPAPLQCLINVYNGKLKLMHSFWIVLIAFLCGNLIVEVLAFFDVASYVPIARLLLRELIDLFGLLQLGSKFIHAHHDVIVL